MTPSLARSYAFCQQLTRREAGNFYPAFRILPSQQRLSMCALYAFMRIADDLSDSDEEVAVKRGQLAAWRQGLRQALAGNCGHPIHEALHDTVARYRIPPRYLEDVIDGVRDGSGAGLLCDLRRSAALLLSGRLGRGSGVHSHLGLQR